MAPTPSRKTLLSALLLVVIALVSFSPVAQAANEEAITYTLVDRC
ncbi:BZ3500_MvSof-1268-A1-R1_Chr3-2g06237 [Microbotryum saponariae]|uniref:BZ3500_MvSof-1268-A1-R1_Chr3-2g06237 protein n=1 Tax=Microbotryum saponariae TaxID=289078 RepID=A0A2X0LEI3_9BASI|nr:BZ3500_MvSof-1268-A1-R1_Chr3-2g06237 [Microbotryum saponariae]SDA04179.1 BZ3501_MvSof-1269-A2-R1_Chr3-2g05928 [Microbotryum saponariae]